MMRELHSMPVVGLARKNSENGESAISARMHASEFERRRRSSALSRFTVEEKGQPSRSDEEGLSLSCLSEIKPRL
jgi:hypothetical protein